VNCSQPTERTIWGEIKVCKVYAFKSALCFIVDMFCHMW
jgi:hypothetical protein